MRLAPDALLPPSFTCRNIRYVVVGGYMRGHNQDIVKARGVEKSTTGLGALARVLQPVGGGSTQE